MLTLDEIEIALSQKFITSDQAAWSLDQLERERCMSDLFYLTRDVLGYTDLSPAHVMLCSIVSSVNPLIRQLAGQLIYKKASPVIASSTSLSTNGNEFIDSGVGGGG